MDKISTYLLLLMGLLGIISPVINLEHIDISNIHNTIFILVIIIINLYNKLWVEKYKILISLSNIILVYVFHYIGSEIIIILLPILFFELLNKYISLFGNLLISILGIVVLNFDKFIYVLIYIFIINLYLYSIKREEEIISNLRKKNKDTRNSEFSMKRRIDDFDRYIEQNKLMTKLKERNYIAQKLHDHLGHRITSSIMQLEVTKETIGTNNEISMKYLESAMSNLREGMEEIREFLRNIKPTEKLVRVEDIKDMIFEFQYNTSIKCKFILEGQIDHISSRMMQVFNDNIKESLTNISKYANATEAIVGIYIYNKVIRVEVRDNGIGCEKVNQDLGFKGMKERLREINGVLNYYNDNGFVVSMLVRLEDNNEY